MLSRTVCQKCYLLRRAEWPYEFGLEPLELLFRNDWSSQLVLCVDRKSPLDINKFCRTFISEEPPEHCPYLLEHIVLKNKVL